MRLLTTATSRDAAQRNAKIALLPVGSFEQHGPYLPLITDTVVACAISERIEAAYPVFVLPPLTISCSHEHADFAGTVSLSAPTLYKVVDDIASSLAARGLTRLVLVNGHGGNYVLRNYAQEASAAGRRTAVFPGGDDWRRAREDAGMATTDHDDMHAGELETSVLMHVWPELVQPGNETADHAAGGRPHLLTLGMGEYTKSGVIGAPSLGTADKGRAALESLVRSFGEYAAILG